MVSHGSFTFLVAILAQDRDRFAFPTLPALDLPRRTFGLARLGGLVSRCAAAAVVVLWGRFAPVHLEDRLLAARCRRIRALGAVLRFLSFSLRLALLLWLSLS